MNFKSACRRLLPAAALILLASAVLLLSDLGRRRPAAAAKLPVALFQIVSRPTLDDGMAGAIAGLGEEGFVDGVNMELKRFNAENDIPTANTIAKQIADGRYRLVLTVSTTALQVMAAANKAGRAAHIFGIVTDPAGAGVGISREHPLAHPSWLAGIGTFQPVAEVFRLAKRVRPELKTVGVVWCPAEACSLACVEKARAVCRELGIKLLEQSVENSIGVREAAQALISQGAQALWIGGDNVVETAAAQVIEPARRARIPVFTNNTDHPPLGALFALGADYREVGRLTGMMAGRVLKGLKPSEIKIEDVVPPLLSVNRLAEAGLSQRWDTKLLADRTDIVIDKTGAHDTRRAPAAAQAKRKWRIALVKFVESPSSQEGEAGIRKGLAAAGLKEGVDFQLTAVSAQGDMSLLNGVMDSVAAAAPDLIFTLSTPTLQKAVKSIKKIPVVFTFVADPVTAGAGRSLTDHLPNITGAFTRCDYGKMIAVVRKLFPKARRLGTLYSAGEANSQYHCDRLEEAAKAQGLELVRSAVNTSSEVSDAAAALCAKNIDVMTQVMDNLTDAAFPAIVKAAKAGRMPLLGFSTANAEQGAVAAVARDYVQGGVVAAGLAAEVMKGRSPAAIPMAPVDQSQLIINRSAANALGIRIPGELSARADRVIE